MNMREIGRLGIILMFITMLSAGMLAYANDVTEPLIEEQRIRALENSIFKFFPDANELKIEETEEREYYLAMDGDEELGFGVVVKPTGYGGEIEMMVAVDYKAKIQGIEILSHGETPGLGDAILDEEWREQFVGLSIEEDIRLGDNVDAISGATISANAVTSGVNQAFDLLAEQYLDDYDTGVAYFQLEELLEEDFECILCQGEGYGLNPGIEVELTIKDNKIKELELLDYEDTPDYIEKAWDEIKTNVMEKQTLDIDAVSGATASSEGILNAIRDAIIQELDATGEWPLDEDEG